MTKPMTNAVKIWPVYMQATASLLLAGLMAMSSDSWVVKPAPVNIEATWNLTLSGDKPVSLKATWKKVVTNMYKDKTIKIRDAENQKLIYLLSPNCR
jgi:hypothetical protein